MKAAGNPFKVNVTVFDGLGLTCTVDVGEGERIVFLVRGDPAVLGPDAGPGSFEISAEQIGKDMPFPIAAAVVPKEHLSEWAALDAATVGRMLDRVSREAGAIRATGARLQ
ncbi:hypothetical protein LOK46_13670 [Methylobacterium sp. NMS14P]|uniref:hypothetical protein n=1 Tax=Methylobacterium sp. NMS14P TaxID=2894310 RepID=UPI0023583093|nr:hypothetical protein [Methylobacterium sp. NMS14P]WCS27824.1 hypothetical protein LOK46_13670 [Methylobacterium sp. NMS14P]